MLIPVAPSLQKMLKRSKKGIYSKRQDKQKKHALTGKIDFPSDRISADTLQTKSCL